MIGRFAWAAVLLVQPAATLAVILGGRFPSDCRGIGYRLVPRGRRPERAVEPGRAPDQEPTSQPARGQYPLR